MIFNHKVRSAEAPTTDREEVRVDRRAVRSSGGTATGDALDSSLRLMEPTATRRGRRPRSCCCRTAPRPTGATRSRWPQVAAGAVDPGLPPSRSARTRERSRCGGRDGSMVTEQVPPDRVTLREIARVSRRAATTRPLTPRSSREVYERLGSKVDATGAAEITAGFAAGAVLCAPRRGRRLAALVQAPALAGCALKVLIAQQGGLGDQRRDRRAVPRHRRRHRPLVPVVTLPEGQTADSPGVQAELARSTSACEALPRLALASYASTGDETFVSDDGRTTFALVYPQPDPTRRSARTRRPRRPRARASRAPPSAGQPVHLTGFDALAEDSGGDSEGPASCSRPCSAASARCWCSRSCSPRCSRSSRSSWRSSRS